MNLLVTSFGVLCLFASWLIKRWDRSLSQQRLNDFYSRYPEFAMRADDY